MFGIGPTELIIVLLAIGVLFFGHNKIINFTRTLGRLSGEFKKGKREMEQELLAEEKKAEGVSSSEQTPQA